MVIEAVFEDIKIKHAVLKEVEAVSVTESRPVVSQSVIFSSVDLSA